MEKRSFSIGQTIYVAGQGERPILGVGHNFLTLDRKDRVSLETMCLVRKYGNDIKCYPCRADYEDEKARQNIWLALREHKHHIYNVPSNLTLAQLETVREILGLTVTDSA